MLPPTTSSRRTWRACSNGAWWPRPPGCGLLCAKLITSPLIQLGWGCRDSPHSEGHLAWRRTVGGALNIWEDSSSLGLAHGTAQLSWLCPGVTRGLRGNPTMIAWARRSWICCLSNRCGRIGQPGTLRPTTFLAWSPSSSTMPRAWSTSLSFGTFGGPGSPHVEDGGTHPWYPSQLTWLRGEHHGPEQFGRYGVGLVPWRLGRNPCHLARLVDCRRLNSVSDASPQCAVPVHPPNVQDVTPSCVETHLQQLRPSDVFLLPGDTEVCSAVSGPARTLQTLAAVVSGVAMAYHPGAYAVQAASEAPPCAETAMERVAATRVEQWRSQWGLQDETDFAYAFASYDSAVAHGGHHVADAWLQARSKSIEEDLIPQAAAVAESSGSKDRPATWPTPKASMMKKSKMVQALRVRPGPDQPEHVLLRAEALRKASSQAKVMRPQGELTPERYSQWQDALDTLAKRKVTEAEGATVVNALKSWAELRAYMEQKDRLFPPDALDLYGFLQNGTSGPYRAFHSLKWFSKHGRLQWDFSDVPVPARKNPPKQANPEQAVAVEPPMIAALEERIQSLYEAGDPRWRGLLSSWLVAFKELSLHLGCQIDLGCQSLVPSWWWSYIWICHLMWHFLQLFFGAQELLSNSHLYGHIMCPANACHFLVALLPGQAHPTTMHWRWADASQAAGSQVKPAHPPCTGAKLAQAKLLVTGSSPPSHRALSPSSWRKPSLLAKKPINQSPTATRELQHALALKLPWRMNLTTLQTHIFQVNSAYGCDYVYNENVSNSL